MLTEREIYEWSPNVGDRIEVVFSDGRVHAHGVLIASYDINPFREPTCLVYCDGFGGAADWPASFRKDQVRRERTITDHLADVVHRLTTVPERQRKRRFWEKTDERAEARRQVDIETARAVIHYLAKNDPPVNIADQIITTTADGLTHGDRVRIYIAERNETGAGMFLAEFKHLRYVIFDSGGITAYPKGDVTKK